MNNGSAIKLTTARYFTPNGRSIQAKGIVPDIIVEDGSDQSNNLHEADLAKHLSNPKDVEAKAQAEAKDPSKEAAAKAKFDEKKFAEPQGPIEPASKDDLQFMQAMNVLKGLPVQKTPELKAAKAKLGDVESTETKK